MEQERRTVTLSLAEYAELLDDSMRYSILYRGILSKASLNYNETGLMFQDGDIDLILKLVDPSKYLACFNNLKYALKNKEEES